MNAIMQGTTPTLKIKIDENDFLLSNVSHVELYIKNCDLFWTLTNEDLAIDTERNEVLKVFTESETSALTRNSTMIVQGRFFFPDGSIVGINKIAIGVADMLGVGN